MGSSFAESDLRVMDQFFADLYVEMEQFPPAVAYVVLLVVAWAENVVPPLPGDVLVVLGGYLAGMGILQFGLVVAVASLGSAAGFMTMYAVGRRAGDVVFDETRLRWLPRKRIAEARDWLRRWGYGVVAANRFLSGARTVISLSVGMARMAAGRTVLWATLSALIWTLLITWLGYFLGDNWQAAGAYFKQWGLIVTTLLLTAIALRWLFRRREEAT